MIEHVGDSEALVDPPDDVAVTYIPDEEKEAVGSLASNRPLWTAFRGARADV